MSTPTETTAKTEPDLADKIAARLLESYTIGNSDGGFMDERAGFDCEEPSEVAALIREVIREENDHG